MTMLEHRKSLKLTQQDVAEKLSIDRATISKWENGEFLPSTPNLIKLAQLYGCTVDDLISQNTTQAG